jgi:hypothetical protein
MVLPSYVGCTSTYSSLACRIFLLNLPHTHHHSQSKYVVPDTRKQQMTIVADYVDFSAKSPYSKLSSAALSMCKNLVLTWNARSYNQLVLSVAETHLRSKVPSSSSAQRSSPPKVFSNAFHVHSTKTTRLTMFPSYPVLQSCSYVLHMLPPSGTLNSPIVINSGRGHLNFHGHFLKTQNPSTIVSNEYAHLQPL